MVRKIHKFWNSSITLSFYVMNGESEELYDIWRCLENVNANVLLDLNA